MCIFVKFVGKIVVEGDDVDVFFIFFIEQYQCIGGFGFFDRYFVFFFQLNVVVYLCIDVVFYLLYFFGCYILEMGKVEVQVFVVYVLFFLQCMFVQDFVQGSVYKVYGGVVVCGSLLFDCIYFGMYWCFYIFWEGFDDVNDQFVFFLGINDWYFFFFEEEQAGIFCLFVVFCVERGVVQDYLELFFLFDIDSLVFENVSVFYYQVVIIYKFYFFVIVDDMLVVYFFVSISMGVGFLGCECGFEVCFIYFQVLFFSYQVGKVDGKIVGIVKVEGIFFLNDVVFGFNVFEVVNVFFEGIQEGFFFCFNDFGDLFLLCFEFREEIVYFGYYYWQQLMDYWGIYIEEGIVVLYCLVEDMLDNVVCFGIIW